MHKNRNTNNVNVPLNNKIPCFTAHTAKLELDNLRNGITERYQFSYLPVFVQLSQSQEELTSLLNVSLTERSCLHLPDS